MIAKLITFLLNLFLRRRRLDIQKPGKGVYLRRWYLRKDPVKGDILLHHILRSDDDRDPHTHPWSFKTYVLAGHYTDEQWHWDDELRCRYFDGLEAVRRWTSVFRPRTHTHRVVLDLNKDGDFKPCWTLVFTGPYGARRDWEFVTQSGPIPWREYLDSPEAEDV